MARELDDAILMLRTNELELGLVLLKTTGSIDAVLASDAVMLHHRHDWLVRETIGMLRRTLARLDVTSRSMYAILEPGSCFAGVLFELALAADRSYMLALPEAEGPPRIALDEFNFGLLPAVNGRYRLETRFDGNAEALDALLEKRNTSLGPEEALELGLVTFAPDDLDWEDEVRIAIEERASAFARRAHRHGGQSALRGRRDAGDQGLRPPVGVAELGVHPAELHRRTRRAEAVRKWVEGAVQLGESVGQKRVIPPRLTPKSGARTWGTRLRESVMSINYQDRIPNNVDLGSNRTLQRALEHWQPEFLKWWEELGPKDFQVADVYLRTATSVDAKGWATYGYVRMPEYRWGIFLNERDPDRRIGFGDSYGQDVWQQIPGEYRATLRRLIVTQGDTEPASVEQQRMLGHTAPSLYDLRNLFQVNVEEGRHLWAMVYLLHAYFGRDGREEAEELLERHSGDADKPRILGTFNEPIRDWLSFFMFTYFTDRDGKFQLKSLAESSFDPLARTCQFMLTEEAHHMFVGDTGINRVVRRSLEVMKELDTDDPAAIRNAGAIDLPTVQRYLNFWFSSSLDLFGSETSSNAASYFANGLKGRPDEAQYEDHIAVEQTYTLEFPDGSGGTKSEQIPMRNAMNEVTRSSYVRRLRDRA